MTSDGAMNELLQEFNDKVDFLKESRSNIVTVLDKHPDIVSVEVLSKIDMLTTKIEKLENYIQQFKDEYNLS